MKEELCLTNNQKKSFINKFKLSLGISRAIFVLTILLFSLSIISAVDFDIDSEFSQGKTLIAKVSGNFLEPILKENIFFYREHVRISIEPYVVKIDQDFYIYAKLLGKNPNNYSIVIENSKYMNGSQASEEDITANFLINNKTADFSIDPGFFVGEQDFFIEVQNLKDSEITISTNAKTVSGSSEEFFSSLFGNDNNESTEDSIILKSGEIEKINFNVDDFEKSNLSIIKLSTANTEYKIPVYIFGEKTQKEKKAFRFEPSELNISLSTNYSTTRIIYLTNTGTETLENISLSISDSLEPHISFSIKEIEELENNSSVKIELEISSSSKNQTLEGQLVAKTNQEVYAYNAIFLNFIQGYIPSEEEETSTDQDSDEPLDDSTETEALTGKIIGWVIVVAIVGFLFWFFKTKYKGTKKDVDLLKIAKGKR